MATQIITLNEAANLSNNKLMAGVIEDVVSYNEWYNFLPFIMFDGLTYTFNREKELARASFAAPGADLDQLKYQKGATFQPVNVNLTAIIGEIILDDHINQQLSETQNQFAQQVSSKAKVMARLYMNAIVNGRKGAALTQSNNGYIGIAEGFDGMKRILDAESGNVDDVNHPFFNAGAATQTKALIENDASTGRAGLEGSSYTLEDLDDLIDRVTAGECHFLMMNPREMRHLRTLLRNTGVGITPPMIQGQGLGTGMPGLWYNNIPVFRNDYISVNEGVNLIDAGTIAAVGATSITTDFDNSPANAVLAAAILAGTAMIEVRGADDVLRKYKVTAVTTADPAVLTVTATGSFLDVESNLVVAQVAPNAGSLDLVGVAYNLYERADGSEIYAGRFGEMEGVCGFSSSKNMENGPAYGWELKPVGLRESTNATQWRLCWYVGFDLFKRIALARLKAVIPAQV